MDHEARNALLERSLPRILLIARRYTCRLPPGVDLDDLIQETVERMARHLDQGLPWSWMRVEGAMLDFLRLDRTSRRGPMPLEIVSAKLDPEALAIRSDSRRVVQRAAASLSPREQALLRMAAHGASGQRLSSELRLSDRHIRRLKKSASANLVAALAA